MPLEFDSLISYRTIPYTVAGTSRRSAAVLWKDTGVISR
jgi:hypothetical protein